ncbi:MAG: AAA family ATPase [Holophagales bacterium]|nr:AAA family ATPase [Holophagales bacterium]
MDTLLETAVVTPPADTAPGESGARAAQDPNTPSGEDRRECAEIRPAEIFEELRLGVLGQNRALRFVSVAIYKHTTGKVPGNLMMIGNSGTGKTTIMNNIQRLYNEVPEYRPFRAVTIINANLLVDVDRMEFQPQRLFQAVEQRARAICPEKPTAAELRAAIERATLCIDEIDKMSAIVAGKPNPIGVVLQQGLLTLMEGERLAYPTFVWENGEEKRVHLDIDTSGMMFICGGAFEGLYDQVYNRVLKPGSGEKLRTRTVRTAEGKVKMETVFDLADFLKSKDLFDFGMVPQFMARFGNTVLLSDLSVATLKEILLHSNDSPFRRSRRFFEVLEIALELEDLAAALIAEEAARDSRTGARALRPIFADLVNPYEFDPEKGDRLQAMADGRRRLELTADMVRQLLR